MLREKIAKLLTDWTNEPNWLEEDIPIIADSILSLLSEGGELLTKKERMNVNIPCDTCSRMPEVLSRICLDCIAKCHEKAQLAKDNIRMALAVEKSFKDGYKKGVEHQYDAEKMDVDFAIRLAVEKAREDVLIEFEHFLAMRKLGSPEGLVTNPIEHYSISYADWQALKAKYLKEGK